MSARSATALADVVVLAVTLRATIHSFNASKRMNFQLPLITTLVRDGERLQFGMRSLQKLTRRRRVLFCVSRTRSPDIGARLDLFPQDSAGDECVTDDFIPNQGAP